MSDSNAPEPDLPILDDDATRVETPDDVIGGGAFVDGGGRPEAGMSRPDRRGDAPTNTDGEVIGAGASDGLQKDPEDWVTGDEPMTPAQRSYLDSLAKQAGETLPADLTKAQASEHIDRLQAVTGRGSGA